MSMDSSSRQSSQWDVQPRLLARELVGHVMRAVDVTRSLQDCFRVDRRILSVGPGSFDLRSFSRVIIAAVGKAAVPMADYAIHALRDAIAVEGVVVGPDNAWQAPSGIRYLQGGHPVPDLRSLRAGEALLQAMHDADETTLTLFLISGGASAMAEAPLDASIDVQELLDFYQQLLHSGLPITKINALRKHFSGIKGGRLALAANGASRCTLLISDVPAGRLDVVGSGPSLPDSSTVQDCRDALEASKSLKLPPTLQRFLEVLPETPKLLPEGRFPSLCFSALSNDSLLSSAENWATAAGYRVVTDVSCDDWDYRDAAQYLFDRAQQESAAGLPFCLISGGEVTVTISGPAGRGGRNQQWALEMARLMAGRPGWIAISFASDGVDGNSPAAGAVVDGSTWSRASASGMDPRAALGGFDTYPLFLRLEDVLVTGPTGNNLRDLRMILVRPEPLLT